MRLRPEFVLERVTDLTPEHLRLLGTRGLLLDLDNTLLPPNHEGPVPSEIRNWIEELRQAGVRVALVTNAKPRRVRRVVEELGIPGVGPVGKPLPLGFLWGLRRLGLPREQVLVVGDQVFTDLLGARILGLRAALVRPLARDALPSTRWLRRLERHFLEESPRMKAWPFEGGEN